MSLSFLFCKPWHPATTWNQKKIWEAEQRDEKRKRDETTAKKELERESDRRRYEQMAVGKKEPDPTSASLNFMYAPPPGFQQPQEKELDDDDEAVKKFKALAKLKSDPNFSAAASCSELEKLVGRRKNPGVSLAEQQERFPFLKDAPVEHAYAADVKVNFKPFNNVVRHVKCMRCGEWGHRSGDRECKLINENPNDKDRRRWEDPMSYLEESAPPGEVATGSEVGQGIAEEDPDAAFLSTLSSKKKRRLLRLLQDMEVGGGGKSGEGGREEGRKGERKRKRERKSSGSGDKEKKGDGRHRDGEKRESVKDSHGKGDEGAERREGRSNLGDEAQEKGTKRRALSLSDDEFGSDRGDRRGRKEGKRSKRSRRTNGERRSGESSRKRGSRNDRDRDGTGRRGSERSHDSRSKDRGAKGDSGERRKR